MGIDRRSGPRSAMGRFALRAVALSILLVVGNSVTSAQDTPGEDDIINAVRPLGTIGPGDQRRIGDWVQARVDSLARTPPAERADSAIRFRERFRDQVSRPDNTAAFKQQFPAQTAAVAVTQFANPNLDPFVGRALGRVLLDMAGAETVPAFLAGLKSKDPATRYFCAEGLLSQRSAIAADKDSLDKMAKAIREAGQVETSPVVLGRLYLALSAPANQAGAVFDTYGAIFEKRLQYRRGPVGGADGAENDAFEYFRNSAILGTLSQQQKEQLSRSLAVFLRLDAQRYAAPDLDFEEIDRLERALEAEEEILSSLVGAGKGGNIRDVLNSGGYEQRGDVLTQAYLWIGDAGANQQGALNAAPWNVPIGAP